MALDGSGTYNRVYNFADDRDAGVKILAARMDEEIDSIAVALSKALYKDGQQTPTANIPMGGFKITGLGTPTADTDASTKAYVDNAASPSPRVVCRAATTANITISTALNNGDTLDGVTLATDDLVLVKDQTNAAENGIYKVAASPARDASWDTWDEHLGGIASVTEGTVNADTLWACMANSGGTLESDDIIWASSGSSISLPLALASGGLGVALSTPTVDSIPFWDQSAGQVAWLTPGTGLEISGTSLQVSENYAKTDTADQVLTGGFRITPKSDGSKSSGTYTPDPGDRGILEIENAGAFTLAPGSNTGYYILQVTNHATMAGTITVSGWDTVVGSFNTTANKVFICIAIITSTKKLLQIQEMD